MKPIRSILLIMSIAVASQVFAQAPQRFNYQAVARDASGNALSEKDLGIRISILDNTEAGTTLFTENFSAKTNKQGLFSIQVGNGNTESGSFAGIAWGSSPKFLKVEIDPAGGTSYVLLGTSQLISVPYALTADRLTAPLPISELADVSDVVPMVDQILKWNGTEWTPSVGGGALVTSSEFLGSGTSEDPLKFAPQGATNGQVLQWNGSSWQPATVSGGVGDNWGTQSVITSTVLQGTGTVALPLTLAQQGAGNGEVLKWNGTKWAPAADIGTAGDNWGTQKVVSSSQFAGDGTSGNPLKLGQNAATTGQVLTWSGTGWVPSDAAGSLTLPASASVSDPGVALQIQNNSGTGIVGINNSNTANVYGIQGRVLTSTGAGTAGVFGKHGATGTNGYGVYGQHAGTGSGVYGEALGAAGYGVYGLANGANGVGVYGISSGATAYGIYGLANTGVAGITNTAGGNGIYGNATAGGYAGSFDERVRISGNASSTKPTLLLNENETSDRARLRFSNNVVGAFWDISANNSTGGATSDRLGISNWSAGELLSISGAGYVGLAQVNPTERLDIIGNIKLSGGVMVGGSLGSNGQVLTSIGGTTQWKSPTTAMYNNTYFFDQNAVRTINNNVDDIPGLAGMSITLAGPSRVIMTFSHSQFQNTGGLDMDVQVNMGFTTATSVMVTQAIVKETIEANKTRSISYTLNYEFPAAGQFLPFVGVTTNGQLTIVGPSGTQQTGQVTIQVIPQ